MRTEDVDTGEKMSEMRRVDSLNIEAGKVSGYHGHGSKVRTNYNCMCVLLDQLDNVFFHWRF